MIDLHLHSTDSDGTDTPTQIIDKVLDPNKLKKYLRFPLPINYLEFIIINF